MMVADKDLLDKLNRISAAWKDQFHPPYQEGWTPEHFKVVPDLPLIWKVEEGILYLDNIWICPINTIRQDSLNEAPEWVNPMSIELELSDSYLDIFILKELGEDYYTIAGVERAICRNQSQ